MTEWVSDCCGAKTEEWDKEFDFGTEFVCRKCDQISKPVEVKEWDEIRLTLNDFESKPFKANYPISVKLLEEALAEFGDREDLQISRRHVRQEITEWEDVTKEELEK